VAGKTKVGILALQGAVEPHARHLERVGAVPVLVRKPAHLEGLAGIILPGGESTTMLHLLHLNKVWEPLQQFIATKPSWGVCAGTILLAAKVTHPEQESLGAIDIDVARNAFGRQVDSFVASLTPTAAWPGESVEGVFIRAPRITRVGQAVKTLLEYEGEPVLVEQGKAMASSFHPELTDSLAVHHYFITKCESEDAAWTTASPKPYASLSIN
jgi:5'-phosphate synthase pdxT subunit